MSVIDMLTGKSIASTTKQGMTVQVAWTTADDKPLLPVATGQSLTAWHITPEADGAE